MKSKRKSQNNSESLLRSKVKTTSLFATQIYRSSLMGSKASLNKLIRRLEEDAFQIFQGDRKGQSWSQKNYKNGYTSYGSLDRVDLMTSSFGELKKQIDKHIWAYVGALHYDCNPKDLVMTQCWVNVMFDHTYHSAHIHPNAVISGTFYVNMPSGASPIQFEDPRLANFMNTPTLKPTAPAELLRFYKVFSKPGDLVLFESWLRHEVPMGGAKLKENPRISISFNYGLK